MFASDVSKITIGVTGGIGAGKSAATDYLREKGYAVVDADEVAREAVRPGEPALDALVAAFGRDMLRGDGTLDRLRLASIVFADAEKTRTLNEILHGDIKRRIEDRLHDIHKANDAAPVPESAGVSKSAAEASRGRRRHAPVFLSAPLLYESGIDAICGEVWLIAAPEEIRIARAASRDGTTLDETRARAVRQMSEGEKRTRADVVIENAGAIEHLRRALDDLLERWA
ncbi:MAG: dephospho-CoA kinase [Clostridiales Family XIII bacterium]|jgi:dephospho-CoA kinase|nr:dephospho-CoA kinase [Clostridiales Family XIII bacterium]